MASSTTSSASSLDLQVGREAALIAHGGGVAALLESTFFRVWKTSTPMRSASEKLGRSVGGDHELLHVDGIVGVRAAVEDIHHGDGQDARADSAEVAVERRALRRAAAARAAARETARMALAPRRPLFGVPSSSIMTRSISPCWDGVLPCSALAISPLMWPTALRVPLPR